jgi:hypothetical protein
MKLSNLSALNQHYVKRIGIIFASIFIIMEIVAKLTGTIEQIDLRLVNLYIMLALFMAAFSKDKVDDERSKIIRYFTLKVTFRYLLAAIATNYILELNIESIYIAISFLIIYLIIFQVANYYNPEFIFKEETKQNKRFVKLIVIIMIFIGIAFLFNIIKTIIIS